ncbi:hypothetical protein [Pseudogemmobacter bohemicus]|uniref:hypothetical protein n=1 Tax=Pseudogemmobacter bohemicus TaxID=2250708 RepID=UPI000DD4870A|nr:hypothetical protein [Pseudogemmobacter bohemicus]
MAVKRIADSEGIREISEEIGANKSLLAYWVKQINLEQDGPKFFEVMAPQEMRPVADTKANSLPREEKNTMLCRIRVEDTEIAIPPSYPAGDLAGILGVVRAAQ